MNLWYVSFPGPGRCGYGHPFSPPVQLPGSNPSPFYQPAPPSPGDKQQAGKHIVTGIVPDGKDAVIPGDTAIKDGGTISECNDEDYHEYMNHKYPGPFQANRVPLHLYVPQLEG